MQTTAMASTTLIAFFLRTSRDIRRVELLGSWDNFRKPYPMELDKRQGKGNWRGCHTFTDIVCDGVTLESLDVKRNGALMEGGRYWYYYQLDNDVEVYDHINPVTTSCPFLPGQKVNILEIPLQVTEASESLSAPLPTGFTLDPADKFRPLKPLACDSHRHAPTSQHRPVSRYGTSSANVIANPFSGSVMPTGSEQPDCASICSEPAFSSDCFPGSLAVRPFSTGRFAWGDYINPRAWGHQPNSGSELQDDRLRQAESSLQGSQSPNSKNNTTSTDDGMNAMKRELVALDSRSALVHGSISQEHCVGENAAAEITSSRNVSAIEHCHLEQSSSRRTSVKYRSHNDSVIGMSYTFRGKDATPIVHETSSACALQHTSSISSARTSGMWSALTLGSASDHAQLNRLSRPLTPLAVTVGEAAFTGSVETSNELSHLPERHLDGGFLGYSLSEADYSSALTIRNLQTATSCTPGQAEGIHNDSHRKQLVEAWNDGNEHRNTVMQDLVDDLGYLGSIIA